METPYAAATTSTPVLWRSRAPSTTTRFSITGNGARSTSERACSNRTPRAKSSSAPGAILGPSQEPAHGSCSAPTRSAFLKFGSFLARSKGLRRVRNGRATPHPRLWLCPRALLAHQHARNPREGPFRAGTKAGSALLVVPPERHWRTSAGASTFHIVRSVGFDEFLGGNRDLKSSGKFIFGGEETPGGGRTSKT